MSDNPITFVDPDGEEETNWLSPVENFIKGYKRGKEKAQEEIVEGAIATAREAMDVAINLLSSKPEEKIAGLKGALDLALGVVTGPFKTGAEAGENLAEGLAEFTREEPDYEKAGEKIALGEDRAKLAVASAVSLGEASGGLVRVAVPKRPLAAAPKSAPAPKLKAAPSVERNPFRDPRLKQYTESKSASRPARSGGMKPEEKAHLRRALNEQQGWDPTEPRTEQFLKEVEKLPSQQRQLVRAYVETGSTPSRALREAREAMEYQASPTESGTAGGPKSKYRGEGFSPDTRWKKKRGR